MKNTAAQRAGLPGWTYLDPDMFSLERECIFRRHWHIACHISHVAEAGDFITLDIAGERALVIRGKDGVLRGFHNLCRHRGSRVVAETSGNCPGPLVCPFHAWSFNHDGTLRTAARSNTLPPLDPQEWGLKPLSLDIWQGFVFIRFADSPVRRPSERFSRFDDEVAAYDLAGLVAAAPISVTTPVAVNWKSVRDVDNEGYHVAKAHPGLHALYGGDYRDEPCEDGISRSIGRFNDPAGNIWSVRHYLGLMDQLDPPCNTLPRQWVYLGMFPNTVIGLYPDSVIFYQDIPIDHDHTAVRYAVLRRPREGRAQRLARYLSMRIDAITGIEDEQLTIWSYEAMKSSAFDGLMLSDLESGVMQYHAALRQEMPVMEQATKPEGGTLAALNAALLDAADRQDASC